MPRRRRRSEPEFRSLAIRIEGYQARAEAGININLLGSLPWVSEPAEEPVSTFRTMVELEGRCISPEDRAGDRYQITLAGATAESPHLRLRVMHLHQRDARGSSRYRKHRDQQIPVYDEPNPLARLSKVRGEPRWTAWVEVAPQMVSDSLLLLSNGKRLYLQTS